MTGSRRGQILLTTHSFDLAEALVDRGAAGIELSNRGLVTRAHPFGA